MKPIVSNPKGYHIHSPSAFHLVTGVIFNRQPPPGMSPEKVLEMKKKFPFGLLVIRLAAHFRPQRVVCIGSGCQKLDMALEPSDIPHQVFQAGDEGFFLSNTNEFVIWNDAPSREMLIHSEINDCVWFLPGLGRKTMREFFTLLKKNGKVSQSFELKHDGFVIFNSKLQKEDYIISNRGFLIDL